MHRLLTKLSTYTFFWCSALNFLGSFVKKLEWPSDLNKKKRSKQTFFTSCDTHLRTVRLSVFLKRKKWRKSQSADVSHPQSWKGTLSSVFISHQNIGGSSQIPPWSETCNSALDISFRHTLPCHSESKKSPSHWSLQTLIILICERMSFVTSFPLFAVQRRTEQHYFSTFERFLRTKRGNEGKRVKFK